MRERHWYRCGDEAGVEPLSGLRTALTALYREGNAAEHALIVVATPWEAEGFDKLAIPLTYTRVLEELPTETRVAAAGGMAIALMERGQHLPATLAMLRMRLSKAVDVGRPQVWVQHLPGELRQALRILDKLCD
ncbi:MAG: hypothetical protein ACRDXX_04950 [Stackebrandtia sp.]